MNNEQLGLDVRVGAACCLNELVKQKYVAREGAEQEQVSAGEKAALRSRIVPAIATNHAIGPIW